MELWTFVMVEGPAEEAKEPLHEHEWVTAYVMDQGQWLPVATFCRGCELDADQLVDAGSPITLLGTDEAPPCECVDCEDEVCQDCE